MLLCNVIETRFEGPPSFEEGGTFRLGFIKYATEFANLREKRDNLRLLFRLSICRRLISRSNVGDLGLKALLLLLPSSAVVDLIVVLQLKIVILAANFPVLLTKATKAVPLELKFCGTLISLVLSSSFC